MAGTNTLLLLTDQERFDVTDPDGPPVDTQNIDRLAREGMTFERAYTPISLCTPARGSLLSGEYPHTHGMLNNCHEPDAVLKDFPAGVPTFGELLADAGYDNTYVGKWHVGDTQRPEDFGFRYLGEQPTEVGVDEDFRDHQREHGVDPDDVELEETIYTSTPSPTLVAAKTPVPPEATRTYYLAERTIKRLEAWADGDGPFFHRTDFPGPHHPYVVPEPYASMYDPEEIVLWDSFQETYGAKPAVQQHYLHYRGVEDFSEEQWQETIAKYFGFVSFIDAQIGRILDAMDDLDLRETAVFHTSDHGDFTGSHRQFNKGPLMYEETYHVPLVVRWPEAVDPGSRCEAFVRLLDLMPTFLELGNVTPPADIEGRSIVPLLRGERPEDWPESVFAEYHGDEFGLYSQRMVRTDRYKYVYNPPDTDELYDLDRDPDELHNVIDNPQYAAVRSRLRTELADWMERTDDTIALWSQKVLRRDEN